MIELMAGRATVRGRSLAVILAILLTSIATNPAPAADPAQGAEGRHTSLHSGTSHANLIIFAQWKTTTTKKESWLKKAWRNPKQKPWFFVVGSFVLVTVVVGGYYLVGATASYPELFANARMGTTNALETLLVRASALGLLVRFTDPFYDIDVAVDLKRLAAELHLAPQRAPRTAAWLVEWRRALVEHRSSIGAP